MKIEIQQDDGTTQYWEARKPKGREVNSVTKVADGESGEIKFEELAGLLKALVIKDPVGKAGSEVDFEEVDADVLLELFYKTCSSFLQTAAKFQLK